MCGQVFAQAAGVQLLMSSPRGALLGAAGGVLLGLLGAGATVVFSIVTANTLVTEDGVERLLGLPVLLSLPVASRKAGTVTLPLE